MAPSELEDNDDDNFKSLLAEIAKNPNEGKLWLQGSGNTSFGSPIKSRNLYPADTDTVQEDIDLRNSLNAAKCKSETRNVDL